VFLISGYSWLYQSLPFYLKGLTNAIPSTPYFAAFTRITQMGAGFNEVLPELIHLLVLTIAGYVLAYFRINSIMKKSHNNKEEKILGLKTA
jgi:ABC-2 type transport system permease protein